MTTSDLALPPWLGIVVVAAICTAAVSKGGWPERLYGLAIPVGWAITVLVRDYSFAHPQWGGLAVDIALLILLMWLGLRSDRFWPMWAAGFKFLAVVTHAARMLDPSVGAWAYITAGVIWSYLGIAALAFGVSGAIRRRRIGEAQSGP